MFLKKQKQTLSFLLALILVLSTFLSVAVFPASAATGENYGVKLPDADSEVNFSTLQAAINYVGEAGNPAGTVITVLGEEGGVLDYNEDCTIPSGTTLLIPFDSAHTLFGDDVLTDSSASSQTAMNTYVKPSNFMTLNMQPGSALTVAEGGAIYLGGKAFTSAVNNRGSQLMPGSGLEENRQSVPSGPDGRIHMNAGSRITVGNGGKLYAFGYIYGTDDDILVEAKNGAEVYEYFQITGWPGWNAVGGAMNNNTFPLNQYYIQNIEVPLKINYGANEIVYSTLFNVASALVPFIGDGGMFQIENDGYLIKDYIEATDRLSIESHCDATLGGLSLTVGPVSMSTSDFPYLPLTNNISITVAEGSVDVAESVALLPGTELKVNEGATVSVAEEKAVYVMSRSDWELGYAMPAAEIFPVAYATSADDGTYAGTPFDGIPMTRVEVETVGGQMTGLKGKDLQDAEVDINGTAVIYGAFLTKAYDEYDPDYSSNVHSSRGTGEIKYASADSSETVNFYSAGSFSSVAGVQEKEFAIVCIKQSDGNYYTLEQDDDTPGEYHLTGTDVIKTAAYHYVDWCNGSEPFSYGVYAKGEVPVFSGTVPSGEGEWIGWTTDPDDPEAELIPCGSPFPAVDEDDVQYHAVFRETDPVFKKHSLSLNGTIGVNFYVDISGFSDITDPGKLTMDFEWGNAYVSTNTYSDDPYTKTVSSNGTVTIDGTTLYGFTVPVAAKELNDKITAILKYDGAEISRETYSGTTYAYKLLATDIEELNAVANNNDGAGLKSLVTSMLNYCSAAQDNFAYNNSVSHANDGLPEKQKKLAAVNTLKLKGNTIGDLPEGVSYYGGSLNLGSETSYMVVLRNDNKLDLDVSAKYADTGEDLATEVRSSGVAAGLNLQNIPAAKVTSDITMTINGSCTATVNTGSYIKAVLDGSYSADLQNVMKALYHYNQAAVKYFG